MYMNSDQMKHTTVLIKYCVILMLLTYSISCQHSSAGLKKDTHEGKMFVQAKAFPTASGWGYTIYVNDSLYIRQSFIPGLNGRHSFASREDALKTGELAIKKMAITHKMPFISQKDLQQLHIQMSD